MKVVTVLIYFNENWPQEGGRLRLVRSPNNINDYAAEVMPEGGNLIAFRRNEPPIMVSSRVLASAGPFRCTGSRRSASRKARRS